MTGPSRWVGAAAAVALPAAVFLAQAPAFRTRTSVTYDETFYLGAAKAVFRHGAFDAPARAGAAPLPVVLAYGTPQLAYETVADVSYFGAMMEVALVNDGPVTVILER